MDMLWNAEEVNGLFSELVGHCTICVWKIQSDHIEFILRSCFLNSNPHRAYMFQGVQKSWNTTFWTEELIYQFSMVKLVIHLAPRLQTTLSLQVEQRDCSELVQCCRPSLLQKAPQNLEYFGALLQHLVQQVFWSRGTISLVLSTHFCISNHPSSDRS